MFTGLTAAYALAHTMLYPFSFLALPLFTLIGILFGEWAEPHTRGGNEATASLRTRRIWHYVPAGAIGWVVFSAAVVTAMRPLPAAGLVESGFQLEGIEYNSVRNNVYIGLWSIGLTVAIALLALWLLTRARSAGQWRTRVGALIGAFCATMATAVLTAEALWLGTANYQYQWGGNPWLGLALTAVGMAGLVGFAWYATAMVRSPEPAPQPTAEADRVAA